MADHCRLAEVGGDLPDISVVVLCYRSGERVRLFADRLAKTLENTTDCWQLVLVGNYLPDAGDTTPEVVQALARDDSRVTAVTLPKEGWMGWDARSGLRAATGRYVALIDGDEQVPADEVRVVYEVMSQGGLDMVTTFRCERGDGLWRIFNSWAYNMVFRILFPGLDLRDVNSKPKIFTREFLDRLDLRSDDWFLDAEICIQARRLGARIRQVPTVFLRPTHRKSFVGPRAVVEFLWNLLRARFHEFRNRP